MDAFSASVTGPYRTPDRPTIASWSASSMRSVAISRSYRPMRRCKGERRRAVALPRARAPPCAPHRPLVVRHRAGDRVDLGRRLDGAHARRELERRHRLLRVRIVRPHRRDHARAAVPAERLLEHVRQPARSAGPLLVDAEAPETTSLCSPPSLRRPVRHVVSARVRERDDDLLEDAQRLVDGLRLLQDDTDAVGLEHALRACSGRGAGATTRS